MAILVHCDYCGKPFYSKKHKLAARENGQQHSLCCSFKCACAIRLGRPVLARRRRVKLTCEMCGQEFEETAVHATYRRFCSIACKAEYQRIAFVGEGNTFYGRQHSEESRRQISANHFRWYGDENPNWRGGITELKILIRKSKQYKKWREAVYKRDRYCSVQSGKHGQTWELVAHHIKPFIEILREMLALYPHLSPETDATELFKIALNYEPLWDIGNGMTLLRQEHIDLHSIEDTNDDED